MSNTSDEAEYEELAEGLGVHRVIQPAFNLQDERRPTSACLVPTPKDQGKLSVDRSDWREPRQTFEHFVSLGFEAVGTITVSHADCKSFELSRYHWPLADNDAHSFIDYRHLAKPKAEKTARKLFKLAWKNSGEKWSYIAEEESPN